MISGIKRKTTAVESTKRFFQTVDLIISHFKRDADREMIFELFEGKETTLNDFLIGTAAIHVYHNLGMRVKDALELSQISVDSTKKIELLEKKIFFDEIKTLLKNSFKLECDMLYKTLDFDNKIINLLIREREVKLQDFQREKLTREIGDQFEQNLIEIILNYPPFYFYDMIGDMLGITDEIKIEILEESSAFKDLSVEIEKKLEKEEKEDKFIELSTLTKMAKKIQDRFEFKSYKELQNETMPVRMLKKTIMEHNIDRLPVSVAALKDFKDANHFKRELIAKIENALEEKINYEQFEKEIFQFLKNSIINQLRKAPNDFIYFLECLNECDFNETIYMLNKFGLQNILHLINVDEELVEKVKKNMVRYSIDKLDLITLNDPKKNLYKLAKKTICSLDSVFLERLAKACDNADQFDLLRYLYTDHPKLQELWKILEDRVGSPINDIREYIRKKQVIDKIFFQDLKLFNYSQIISIINFEEIINNIVREIFYYIFSKILRQLGRIIESYQKITNDKALYLVALKKMSGTKESEQWVNIKLEELMIERIKNRQKELVVIFNALNNPFLVNGFIFARLIDSSLKEGINELKEEESPIYEGIRSLTLQSDIISPISYCIAYDLIKRFESFEELRKLKVEQIIESKEKEKEEYKKKLREKQEGSTLNWIERRITSSLMRINSPGINPNQLYWQEKDSKITTDNLKLHSELKEDVLELFSEFFTFALEKIKFLTPDIKIPDRNKIKIIVKTVCERILEKRLNHTPSQDEINSMLDGERFEIAKDLAKRIGKILDKALYTKFKSKKRNNV
ncbi:MAG: hypothetical protein ACTSR8_18935 [Promethearchaeota archaeon]